MPSGGLDNAVLEHSNVWRRDVRTLSDGLDNAVLVLVIPFSRASLGGAAGSFKHSDGARMLKASEEKLSRCTNF